MDASKRYSCDQCDRTLSRRDSLNRHKKLCHSGVRPINTLGNEQSVSPRGLGIPELKRLPTPSESPKRLEPAKKSEPDYMLSTLTPSHFNLPPVCEEHFMPWKHPFTSLIAGPTGSGKTNFVKRFVGNANEIMKPVPDKITWFYDEYQTIYSEMEGVEFVQGLPDVDKLTPGLKHLIIIDDLMTETNSDVATLFTKKSHHRDISVMYIVQNVFHQTKDHRNISLNAHYMVLFKNPRDYSQINKLGQQMFPHRGKDFPEAYKRATFEPYGYLLVDLKQDTDEEVRLRTYVFPGEYQKVYAL